MRYIILAIAIFLLLVFQSGVLAPLGLHNYGNLILLFAIVATMTASLTESLFVVLLGGLFLDFISGTVDGTMILALLVTFGFTYTFTNRFVPKEPTRLTLFTCIILNTILFAITILIFNRIFSLVKIDTALDWKFILGNKLVKDLIINLLFSYPIFWLYNILPRSLNFRRSIR